MAEAHPRAVGPDDRLLLHDHGVRTRWNRGAGEDAGHGPRSERLPAMPGGDSLRHRKRCLRIRGKRRDIARADRIAVHLRVVETRRGVPGEEFAGEDAPGGVRERDGDRPSGGNSLEDCGQVIFG